MPLLPVVALATGRPVRSAASAGQRADPALRLRTRAPNALVLCLL
jgi:hypothetical protein